MSSLRWSDSETSQLHLEKETSQERQNFQSPLDKYDVNSRGEKNLSF